MKIGFIGAGKVGFSLGQFFVQGGLPVTGYYSRHRGSAQEAAAWTGTKQYESLESLVRASDALFLTVPDGAIASVFAQLREFDLAGKQICHCSGALTAREAFPGVEETGAGHYSIHPLFPLCDKTVAWRNYRVLFSAWRAMVPTWTGGRSSWLLWGPGCGFSPAGERGPTMPPAPWPAT